jgi:CheY-like chemotaxis protein
MILRRLERPAAQKAPNTPLAKILYVEDEDANWEVTELQLRGKYLLRRAKTSSEALALLARERFDLILLDIQLSGSDLDGIQLCRVLRAPSRHGAAPPAPWRGGPIDTPIVFVTAYAARYDKQTLLDAGADDVVTKPVDYTRLLLVSSRLIVRAVGDRS